MTATAEQRCIDCGSRIEIAEPQHENMIGLDIGAYRALHHHYRRRCDACARAVREARMAELEAQGYLYRKSVNRPLIMQLARAARARRENA